MSPSVNPLRLAKFDATQWEDKNYGYTYVKHVYYGWRAQPEEELVWRRTIRPIGQGGIGAVYREDCTEGSTRGSARAVKVLPKHTPSDSRSIDYSRELEAIARFSQPQYTRFFVHSPGWFESEKEVSIIMELAAHGNLQQHIGHGLPENEAQLIMKHVLEGLAYMHDEGYTHRDLKPQNLLVVATGPSWHVKIADFGLSKRVAESQSSMHTNAGTLGFIAPEVLGLRDDDDYHEESNDSADQHRQSYTNSVDMWAMGVVLLLLVTGVLPFPGLDQRALVKYASGKGLFPMHALEAKRVSAECCAMVVNFMAPDPSNRPSAKAGLQHQWLQNSGKGWNPPKSNSKASANWTTAESADSGYATQLPSRMPSKVPSTLERPAVSFIEVIKTLEVEHMVATVSPDGKFVATGTKDGVVSLRDVNAWPRCVWHRNVPRDESQATRNRLIYSPCGQWILYCGNHATVQVLHAMTGKPLLEIQAKDTVEPYRTVTSPDGSLICLGGISYNSTAQVINATTGATLLHRPEKQTRAPILGMSGISSPCNKIFASCSANYIELWNTEKNDHMLTLCGHTDSVSNFAFSQDGHYIASASQDRTIRIWEVQTGRELHKFYGLPKPALYVAFSRDGGALVSCSDHKQWTIESEVVIWDTTSGECLHVFSGHGRFFDSVSFWPDDSTIALASERGRSVMTLDRSTGKKILELAHMGSTINIPPHGGQVGWSSDACTMAGVNGTTIKLFAKRKP